MHASQAGRREGDGAAATAAQKAAESADQAVDEANSRFDKARAALRDLRIRRLETLEQEVAVTGEGWSWLGRNEPIIVRVLGWLVATLAASLGAQFSFDALGRLVNVRDAGKKPARS
jgi:heme oxygenase